MTTICVFPLTADIPEEELLMCGAADCGVSVSNSSGSDTRPPQRLIFTLVGCYIGKLTFYLRDTLWQEGDARLGKIQTFLKIDRNETRVCT